MGFISRYERCGIIGDGIVLGCRLATLWRRNWKSEASWRHCKVPEKMPIVKQLPVFLPAYVTLGTSMSEESGVS